MKQHLLIAAACAFLAITPVLAADDPQLPECSTPDMMIEHAPGRLKLVAHLKGDAFTALQTRIKSKGATFPDGADEIAVFRDQDYAIILFFANGCMSKYGFAPWDRFSRDLEDDSI